MHIGLPYEDYDIETLNTSSILLGTDDDGLDPCMHLLCVWCVLTIFSRFRWLKASELMLFFFNFKAGFYERFYSYQ